ncbi:MAG TPA: hypothetical protein VGR02_05205 [Thermoanaerobaculia bacterium]|jgi:hypothetical protein|nr:hypothetical protein [Thermoanaerobaculia bacterium]
MKLVIIGAHLRREDVEPVANAVPVGDIFLSGMPVEDDQPLGDRELLIRVARLRAELLERATFVAIRYGFASSSPEAKALPHAARWKALLEENRSRVEMTLKIAAANPKKRPDRRDFRSGAEYLKALHESTANIDDAFRGEVEKRLIPLSARHVWSSSELALLIERAKLDEVRAAGEELKRTKVPFLLSGPWPLEVFADADHE